jgi:hypothetical protein
VGRVRLAHFDSPTSVDFVEELPRSRTGRMLKHTLREPYRASRPLPAVAVAPLTDEHNSLPPPDAFHLPVGRAVTHKIYRDALHQSGLVLPFTTRGTELPGPFD